MSTIDDGGPAFARPGANWKNADGQPMGNDACLGMSLRDYFAANAMQGFAADPNAAWKDGANGMARCAYDWADAMLKAREQSGSTQ